MAGFLSGGYQSGRTQTSNNTTRRILTPDQQQAMGSLLNFGTQSMTNPTQALSPLRDQAFERINKVYDQAPQNMRESMAARGIRGGTLDRALKELDIQRYGQLAGVENMLAGEGVNQMNRGASILEMILSQMMEQQSSGTARTSGGFNIGFGVGR